MLRFSTGRRTAIAAIFALAPMRAHALDVAAASEWRAYRDPLARVLVAEADGHALDWQAMLWVLEHRRDRSGAEPRDVLLYSATLRGATARVREIHGIEGERSAARTRQLEAATAFVQRWLDGHVYDPCPSATDWHGIADHQPGWFEPVFCGVTRNTFGRLRVAAAERRP